MASNLKKADMEVKHVEETKEDIFHDGVEINQEKPCLFNFIIYIEETRRQNYFREIIDTVLSKFPCRIIFIQSDAESDSDTLKTSYTPISTGNGTDTIICDHFELKSSRKSLKQVPFYLLPLLVPDLQIFVLYGKDPTQEDILLPHFKHYATRIIFDSESSENIHLFSQAMAKKIDQIHSEVVDMNWARIAGWRTALAKVFDSKKKIEDLHKCCKLTIRYNHRSTDAFHHLEIQADYLQGWLASRLKWKFKQVNHPKEGLEIDYEGEHPIKVVFEPISSEKIFPGSISAVVIETKDETLYELERPEENLNQILVKTSTKTLCEVPYTIPLQIRVKSANFVKELFFRNPSTHYLDMLKTIAEENLSCK